MLRTLVFVTASVAWAEQFDDVPEGLHTALGIGRRVRNHEVACAMADELHLSTKGELGEPTLRLLYALAGPLGRALREGREYLNTRGLEIAAAATDVLDLREMVMVMIDLGWGTDEIPFDRRQVRDIIPNVRKLLRHRLAAPVLHLMRRWEERGLFDLRTAQEI